ncbi:MAG: hypothetical protein GW939_01105 [Candidatus Magasanikbacteria bacterium]|nr:hypothetical protein [Candidatus Magasanikbacteria bacterium]NCS72202.1 hypothetical protein [Candidatus Magasanikbacteria bacterium]
MTLIVGLNLSDRIYLAADTRVTITNSRDENMFVDNIIKIVPLYGKHILDRHCPEDVLLSMAVAGDVGLADFVKNSIKDDLYSKGFSSDIRSLFQELNEDYFTSLADKWLSSGGQYGKSCAFIIGGYGTKKGRKINVKKISKMVKIYKEEHKFDTKKEKEIRKALEEDETLQLINKKMKMQANKNIFDTLRESSHPQIPDFIREAISQQKETLDDLPDYFLFCVEFGVLNGKLEFNKSSAEYGQYIARGQGKITEDEISDSLLATIELNPNKGKNQEHLLEGSIISRTILDIAKEKKLNGIGGTVIINCLKENKSEIMSGNCKFIDNKMYINIHNKLIEPVFFGKVLKTQIPHDSNAEL